MAAPHSPAEHIIFIRQLERELESIKDRAAEDLIEQTIDSLATLAAEGKTPPIGDAVVLAEQDYQLAIDRTALRNLNLTKRAAKKTFASIWRELALNPAVVAECHTDIIKAIKEYYLQKLHAELANLQEGSAKQALVTQINNEYYDTRSRYFELLRQKHPDPRRTNEEIYKYKLGDETERLGHEIANKKLEQTLLTWGLNFIAKFFALSQGFFASGGLYVLATAINPFLAIPAAILALPLYYYVTRSNWITINKELGPLLKELFFNPAHAGMSFFAKLKLWFKHSEISKRAALNTVKGSTNLISATFIGILTLGGALSLLNLFTGWIPMGPPLEIFTVFSGAGPIFVIGAAAMAVSILVYFVITNLNQLIKNEGKVGAEAHAKRLDDLRTIDNTPWWHVHKYYGFNITVSLVGISATLVGASVLLLTIFETGITHVPMFFGGVIPAISISLALIVTGIIVLASIYGISPFYQARTRGSTERILTENLGLTFDKLKSKPDVTGLDVPDFGAEARGDNITPKFWSNPFKYISSMFFNMDLNRDDSQTARKNNAIGQGVPALQGSAILFTTIYASFAEGMASALGFVTGMFTGLFAAAWGSYSANSTGMRPVKTELTEMEILKRDHAILVAEGRPYQNDVSYRLGEIKAQTGIYKEGRERQYNRQIDHYGVKTSLLPEFNQYDGRSKLDGADSMVTQLDAYVAGRDQATAAQQPINYLYQAARNKAKNGEADRKILSPYFNPLTDGRLGKLAEDAANVITRTAPERTLGPGGERITLKNT